MISAAFTNNFKKFFPLGPILLIALILRLYKLNLAFQFDYDQEKYAQAAYEFYVFHKISAIGPELSFQGLFSGPVHDWMQFIPYGLCNLMPDCAPYFYILIGLLTIVAFYVTAKKIFGAKTAFIACFIYAISFRAISIERGATANNPIFLTTIGVFYCLHQYFKGKNSFLILGGFLAGLATVNFNPTFITAAVAFFITALLRKEKNVSLLVLSLLSFFINFLPLLIFNFRHDNIIAKSLENFATQNSQRTLISEKFITVPKDILIPFITNYLFQSTLAIFTLLTVTLAIYGSRRLLKYDDKSLLFLPITIITSLLIFVFYGGHIPDYYFQQSLLAFVILVALAIKRKIILLFFSLIFLTVNLSAAVNFSTNNNYQIKKQIISYILEDTKDESFNIYYNLPQGLNTGYKYLLKVNNRTSQDGGKNLYILDVKSFDLDKYKLTFKDKKVSSKLIGFVNIVSVK